MKKKKTDRPAPAEFQHTPFKALKGFAPKTASSAPDKTPPVKKKASADDDPSLFLRAMAGTTRMQPEESDEDEGPAAREQQQQPARAASADDGRLFAQAVKNFGASMRQLPPDEEEPDEPRRSASSRMKQLRRGTLRITAELDLHGFLRDEALAQLQRFIAAASSSGREAVLVITGKGTNSADGPVLPGAVDAWLRTRGAGMVAEFHPAPRHLGGSGAFVVFLRKK